MDKAECPQKGDAFSEIIMWIFNLIINFIFAIIGSFFDSWSIRADTMDDLAANSPDIF